MRADPGFMANYELESRRKNAEQRIRGLMETLATAYQSAAVLHRTVADLEETKLAGESATHSEAAEHCETIVQAMMEHCMPTLLRAARGEQPAAEPTKQ
jgi:hypothetical protein